MKLGRGRSNESDRGLHVDVINLNLNQLNITDLCVAKNEHEVNLEREVYSKSYLKRLKVVWVEAK